MDAGGGNERALTDTTNNQTAVDWMPDSKKLIVVPTQNGINTSPQLLDVAGGASQTITAVQRPSDRKLSISPDGQWIAFTDNVIGRMAPGIFISRLDGSEKRLLVQLDYWMVAFPVWSPDGKWLTFSVTNPDQFQTLTTPSLINVENCQVIPLTGLNGEIEQWINNP
jgi:Tol biopolymer transport system component